MRLAMISFHTCPLAALGGKKTGGMNVYVREVGRQLAALGIGVDVFTRSQNPAIDRIVPLNNGARVIHIPAGPEIPAQEKPGWLFLPEFADGILRFMHEEKIHYDIVHSHYWLSGWAGLTLSRKLRVPLVHMCHTLGVLKNMVARGDGEKESRLRIFLEKRVMDLCRTIVASTPSDRAHMIWHYGVDPEKIQVVPCGVDLKLFRPLAREAAKEHLGLSSRRVILFVGRILPIKGLDCLLKALAILIKQTDFSPKDIHLVVIGGDLDNGGNAPRGETREMKNLTAQLGLDSMVTFLGAQPQHVLPYFYSAAEVCVLPSRYESFGMVALEAMACGTPVIASGVGGLNHTVQHGQTGFLIPEGNAAALAEKLQRVLGNETMRNLMSVHSIRHAQKYAWENIAYQIAALYNRILPQGIAKAVKMGSIDPPEMVGAIPSCLGSS